MDSVGIWGFVMFIEPRPFLSCHNAISPEAALEKHWLANLTIWTDWWMLSGLLKPFWQKIIVIYDSGPAVSRQSRSFFVSRWIRDGVSRFPAISFLIKSQRWFQTPSTFTTGLDSLSIECSNAFNWAKKWLVAGPRGPGNESLCDVLKALPH